MPDTQESTASECGNVTLAEAASGRYPCLVWGDKHAKFWAVAEASRGYDLQLAVLSLFPYPYPDNLPEGSRRVPMHNIDIEVHDIGLEEVMGLERFGRDRDDEYVATFLLNEGLCPNQPFQLDMRVWYVGHTSMDWIGTEWDMECEWCIIGREHVEPEESVRRWAEYLETFRESRGFSGNDLARGSVSLALQLDPSRLV